MEIFTLENVIKDLEAFASLEEIAIKYALEEAYVITKIEKETGLKATDFIKQIHTRSRLKLRQLIMEKAQEGNVAMLSFAAKSYLPENKPTQLALPFMTVTPEKQEDLSKFSDMLKD